MKIPYYNRTVRFYVATDNNSALSSWDTLDQARDSIKRIALHCPEIIPDLIAIIKVNQNGRLKLPIKR